MSKMEKSDKKKSRRKFNPYERKGHTHSNVETEPSLKDVNIVGTEPSLKDGNIAGTEPSLKDGNIVGTEPSLKDNVGIDKTDGRISREVKFDQDELTTAQLNYLLRKRYISYRQYMAIIRLKIGLGIIESDDDEILDQPDGGTTHGIKLGQGEMTETEVKNKPGISTPMVQVELDEATTDVLRNILERGYLPKILYDTLVKIEQLE